MIDIKIITEPDIVYDTGLDILLICPRDAHKKELSKVLETAKMPLNVYLYNNDDVSDWLFTIFRQSKFTIMDLDNISGKLKDIVPYFLAFNKTHWLTNGSNQLYNKINKNQIYNFDFLVSEIQGAE